MAQDKPKTYTVIGEQGNSEGNYTLATGLLSGAIEAVRRQDFPLCRISGQKFNGQFFVDHAQPYYIVEVDDGNVARYYDLVTGNVRVPRSDADRRAGTNGHVKQAWPGAYEGCLLTEELIARPKVDTPVPAEWIDYCRTVGLVR